MGPDAGAAFLGKNFITYAFVQQWFKVGGDGEDTNHMNGTFNFTYMLANGFTIGTQPDLSDQWEAPEDDQDSIFDRTHRDAESCCKCEACQHCSVQVRSLPGFVQTSPVRSGISSCRRRRRSRP